MPEVPATLFFGFRRPLNQAALKRALATCRPKKVGLVSRSNFLGPEADEFLSARNGFRACTYRANPYAQFPGSHLLEQLLPNEVTALRMYERIFRGATTGQSYNKRRTLYREHVAWAYGLLCEGGYQRLIFSEIPHHPFPYVLLWASGRSSSPAPAPCGSLEYPSLHCPSVVCGACRNWATAGRNQKLGEICRCGAKCPASPLPRARRAMPHRPRPHPRLQLRLLAIGTPLSPLPQPTSHPPPCRCRHPLTRPPTLPYRSRRRQGELSGTAQWKQLRLRSSAA